MEIKGTGAPLVQQPQPTDSVQKGSSVTGSQTVDEVVLKEATGGQPAVTLPPPPLPAVELDEAGLRGAESFATQLREMGGPARSGPDLMASFLKLQILQGDVDRNWTDLLSEVKMNMAHLAISNAKQIEAVVGTVALVAAAMRNILQQVNSDVDRASDQLKKLLDETLMKEANNREEDKDEKAVGEEELERKFGKSSMKNVDTLAASQLTSTVTAEAGGITGGAMTMLSIDNMRPDVAGSVAAMVGNNSAAAGLRLQEY